MIVRPPTPSSGRSSRSLRVAPSPGSADRQLLERFTDRRDAAGEAAFAALVTRHGPMVLDVCRQLLGDRHHAEDAFQAVFLVLARKARSIRDPDLLGNWLYGVALRTARKAKVRLARRRENEEGDAREAAPGPSVASSRPTSRPWPASRPRPSTTRSTACRSAFRLPVVLCYFEGLTLDEAARRLRWPAGTVRSRLARRGTSSAAASPAAAWSCPPPPWPRSWTPGPPRRPSHPPCATSRPGPRRNSRPDRPPRPRRRPLPRRCSDPC